MRITNSLLLLIVTVLLSCGGVDRTEIVLNNDMPEDAKHLGGGVYVKLTSAFRKAKSFDGYVAGRNEATVSVQIDDVSLEKVAAQFAKDRLKAQGVELLAMQPVTYNDGLPGLFTMVKDKRKNTYRYLLSIERDGQVYNIKAFCFQPLQEKYEWVINTALKTAFIGEKVEKEEPFKIARIDLLGDKSLTYTRDGEYPTLAPDRNSSTTHRSTAQAGSRPTSTAMSTRPFAGPMRRASTCTIPKARSSPPSPPATSCRATSPSAAARTPTSSTSPPAMRSIASA